MLAAPAVSEDTGVGLTARAGARASAAAAASGPIGGAALIRSGRLSHGFDRVRHLADHAQACQSRIGSEAVLRASALRGRTVACATCHDPARAFTDGRPVSVGIHGRVGQRNAPTILNALYNKHQFWDGRVATLEQQAALPITNPFEMGSASIGDAVSRIAERQGLPDPIHAGLRPGRERAGYAERHCSVRTDAGFVRFSLRSFHRGRGKRHQRLGQTRLGIVQYQGPLQPLPCFDGQSAGRNPLHG